MNTNANNKKAWQKPEIYIIDSNYINSKSATFAQESTAHRVTTPGLQKFWMQASKNALNATNGVANKSSLIS